MWKLNCFFYVSTAGVDTGARRSAGLTTGQEQIDMSLDVDLSCHLLILTLKFSFGSRNVRSEIRFLRHWEPFCGGKEKYEEEPHQEGNKCTGTWGVFCFRGFNSPRLPDSGGCVNAVRDLPYSHYFQSIDLRSSSALVCTIHYLPWRKLNVCQWNKNNSRLGGIYSHWRRDYSALSAR